ncbi:MAG: heavy metal translocating P-type ATPase [Candidatus Nomurabacteria bacterium]|nr:heavy metal translocating P-type ATPase [Candidatus Nomurabacteria bacterium]
MIHIISKVRSWTPFVALSALLLVFISYIFKINLFAQQLSLAILCIFSIPLWYEIVSSIIKKHFGVDLVAGLALLCSLIFGQYLPGIIVLLMLSGGEALESYAMNRARRALSDLLNLIPQKTHVKKDNGVVDIDSSEIKINDYIIVKAGEIIPSDGVVENGESYVDESVMTGESVPNKKEVGSVVLAGTKNTDAALEIRVTKELSDSRLHTIINMVRQAEENKAPFVRMADKYSVYFTVFTIIMAALAYYFGGPIRMLAVLVVATPCPLILATPIAFMSGMSRASRVGIIVKNGGALELLSKVDMCVFDKTGTITMGIPAIHEIKGFAGIAEDEVIKIAASLDQLSVHIFARSLVDHAHSKSHKLIYPDDFKEVFGDGVNGIVNGEKYFFGKLAYLVKNGIVVSDELNKEYVKTRNEGVIPVYLGKGTNLIGMISFKDEIRPEARKVFSDLSTLGIKRFMLLSGDKESVAVSIASSMKINEYKAECLPDEKLTVVRDLQKSGLKVAMIGDGVNDAPALAQADVGIALGSHGATAASESADIVIVSGSIEKVPEAYKIAVRTVRVAREGIFIGIGLSAVCMFVSLSGKLLPLYGALIQEGIDIVVILYALRAGRDII